MILSNKFTSILPSNATKLEKNLEKVASSIIAFNPNLQQIKNPLKTPDSLLLNLADELQVDVWDEAYSRDVKENILLNAVPIHRIKGTKKSIKRGLEVAGFKNFEIYERVLEISYNGAHKYNGVYKHGGSMLGIRVKYDGSIKYNGGTKHAQPSNWAFFSVVFNGVLTRKQSLQAKEIISRLAPARCKLHLIETRIKHNASIKYDGTYSYGGY